MLSQISAGLGQINIWLGAAAGAVIMGFVAYGYNIIIDNPAIIHDTTVKVEAEARQRTFEAINEVTDEAERARAMLRYCRDIGRVYDFETGSCG